MHFFQILQTGDIILFSTNRLLLRFLRLVTWSPYAHVAMVFKGVLPSEKGTEQEELYQNKLRIFHAIRVPQPCVYLGKR